MSDPLGFVSPYLDGKKVPPFAVGDDDELAETDQAENFPDPDVDSVEKDREASMRPPEEANPDHDAL